MNHNYVSIKAKSVFKGFLPIKTQFITYGYKNIY